MPLSRSIGDSSTNRLHLLFRGYLYKYVCITYMYVSISLRINIYIYNYIYIYVCIYVYGNFMDILLLMQKCCYHRGVRGAGSVAPVFRWHCENPQERSSTTREHAKYARPTIQPSLNTRLRYHPTRQMQTKASPGATPPNPLQKKGADPYQHQQQQQQQQPRQQQQQQQRRHVNSDQ